MHFYRSCSRARLTVLALSVVLGLGACSNGPAEFGHLSIDEPVLGSQSLAKTGADKDALEQSLLESAHQQAANGGGRTLPSTMALAIIRQQQVEEARSLINDTSGLQPKCAANQRLADGTCPKLQ